MGNQSIVSGYIKMRPQGDLEQTRQAIASYPFDEVYPFANIFWCGSPKQYNTPLVGFVGSFKEVEDVWSEWLWKFSQFLSTLEAIEAWVRLDTDFGHFEWRLAPRPHALRRSAVMKRIARETGSFPPLPADWWDSWIGEQWIIIEAPENDFSVDPKWLEWQAARHEQRDPQTGKRQPYRWDKLVERWLDPREEASP